MHTDTQAPHKIFNLPQQFVVPLFKRRYRWSEDLMVGASTDGGWAYSVE
jgi:hypothetical protein